MCTAAVGWQWPSCASAVAGGQSCVASADETTPPRGLETVRILLRSLDVHPGGDDPNHGTTVVRCTRPQRLTLRPRTARARCQNAGQTELDFTLIGDESTLIVQGPVEADLARRLGTALRRRSATGQSNTVDLDAVSHLGSAGVRALYDAVNDASHPVLLQAKIRSVAHHVLELVRLPHTRPGEGD